MIVPLLLGICDPLALRDTLGVPEPLGEPVEVRESELDWDGLAEPLGVVDNV